MRQTLSVVKAILLGAVCAFLIVAVGQGVWGALVFANVAAGPQVPWAPLVMAGVLVALLGVLGGRLGPKRGAEARRALLPLKPVAPKVWAWSLAAGGFGIGAIALFWILLGELFPAAPNLLVNPPGVPKTTLAAFLLMSIVAAPLSEEAAFRGYAMGIIRKVMPDGWALVVVSVMFALVHLTQGPYLTKQLVYLLAGLMFGFTAWRAGSLIPAMVVHSAADLTFFTLVWPADAHRPHLTLATAGADFWLQAALAATLAALSLAAYAGLARVTRTTPDAPAAAGLAAA